MPSEYSCALHALPQLNFSSPRELPVGEIFFRILHLYSQPLKKKRCFSQGRRLSSIHCAQAIAAKPVSAEQQAEIIALQRYYCNKRQNDKPVGVEKPWLTGQSIT